VVRRHFQLIDYLSERDSIVFVKELKHLDVGEKTGITRHRRFLSKGPDGSM
jgi:transposase-like protein